MLQLRAFRPLAQTQNLAVTATAQTITLNYPIGTNAIRVCNVGTQTVFFVVNDSQSANVATITTSTPIPAGNTEVFTLGQGALNVSLVAAAVGSTLYITQGEGL